MFCLSDTPWYFLILTCIGQIIGIVSGRHLPACVSPEYVNREDGDGEQEDDCIQEESDDHSRRTRLVHSIEVPVELGCVTHRCVRAVGETLRRRRLKEKKKKKEQNCYKAGHLQYGEALGQDRD